MFYFAYGSNMDERQMQSRCPESALVGIAILDGYRLGFTRYSKNRNGGVADIVSEQNQSVWGLIYKVTAKDMETLDAMEGRGKAYERMAATVRFLDGRTVEAETYYVINKQPYIKPSEEYLALLLNAAKKHKFPAEYVERSILGRRIEGTYRYG